MSWKSRFRRIRRRHRAAGLSVKEHVRILKLGLLTLVVAGVYLVVCFQVMIACELWQLRPGIALGYWMIAAYGIAQMAAPLPRTVWRSWRIYQEDSRQSRLVLKRWARMRS